MQRAPLGLSRIQYAALKDGLRKALEHDGITVSECDIRLKGSSACFFSGLHKAFPTTRDEVIDLFREQRKRLPERWEVDEIMDRLERQWIRDRVYPRRRPFDSLYRLGIDSDASDLDVQLSSDELMRRAEQIVVDGGQAATEARIKHPTYNFVHKDLIPSAFRGLYLFSLHFSDALGRHVSVAIFPASGPPDTTARYGELSAHFRPDDWRIA